MAMLQAQLDLNIASKQPSNEHYIESLFLCYIVSLHIGDLQKWQFWRITYNFCFIFQGGIFVVIALYTTDDWEQSFIAKDGTNIYHTLSVLWSQLCEEGYISKVSEIVMVIGITHGIKLEIFPCSVDYT